MRPIDADELINNLVAVKHIYPLHMIRAINAMPTIDTKPVKHGRWMYESETINLKSGYRCSICRETKWFSPDVPQAFKFCPHMRG